MEMKISGKSVPYTYILYLYTDKFALCSIKITYMLKLKVEMKTICLERTGTYIKFQ